MTHGQFGWPDAGPESEPIRIGYHQAWTVWYQIGIKPTPVCWPANFPMPCQIFWPLKCTAFWQTAYSWRIHCIFSMTVLHTVHTPPNALIGGRQWEFFENSNPAKGSASARWCGPQAGDLHIENTARLPFNIAKSWFPSHSLHCLLTVRVFGLRVTFRSLPLPSSSFTPNSKSDFDCVHHNLF